MRLIGDLKLTVGVSVFVHGSLSRVLSLCVGRVKDRRPRPALTLMVPDFQVPDLILLLLFHVLYL